MDTLLQMDEESKTSILSDEERKKDSKEALQCLNEKVAKLVAKEDPNSELSDLLTLLSMVNQATGDFMEHREELE